MSTVRNDRQKNNRALRTTLTKPPVQSRTGTLVLDAHQRRPPARWHDEAVATLLLQAFLTTPPGSATVSP